MNQIQEIIQKIAEEDKTIWFGKPDEAMTKKKNEMLKILIDTLTWTDAIDKAFPKQSKELKFKILAFNFATLMGVNGFMKKR